MNQSDFIEVKKEFYEILNEFNDFSKNCLDLAIDNIFLSLTKDESIILENTDIKYILVINNGISLKIHKNTQEELKIFEEREKLDFFFLKSRFNKLSKAKKNLIFLVAEHFLKWDKVDKEILMYIFSHFCETPERVKKMFEIIQSKRCFTCNQICKSIKKCINFDCTGICDKCFLDIDKVCSSCHKKQNIVCPICRESWDKKSCRIHNCGHGICWKCISQSWKIMGKDIDKCPECRGELCSRDTELSS